MGNATTARFLRRKRPAVAPALPIGGVRLDIETYVPRVRRVSSHCLRLRLGLDCNGLNSIEIDCRDSSEHEKKAATIVTSTATTRIIHPPEDISLVR